jgi:hypothetical protein
MRLLQVATAASSFGAAAAAAIWSSQVSENTCSNSIFTGEILHLSVNIIEYPVIVDVELKENAVVTIDNTILIECTNAPTHLHTTVYATEIATVTKTISTATITAQQVATASDEATRTVLTQVGSKETSASDASTRTVLTEVSTKGNSKPYVFASIHIRCLMDCFSHERSNFQLNIAN